MAQKATFLMVAKATFLIEPLVAARMALEWIQRHGSCPPNDPRQASNRTMLPRAKRAKATFPMAQSDNFHGRSSAVVQGQ